MPEQWMRELLGEEERPRQGFEDELATQLERGWRTAPAPSPWRKLLVAAAAVALVVVGVAVLTGRDDDTGVVTPATSSSPDTTSGVTASPGPAGAPFVAFGSSVMIGATSELEAAGVVVDAKVNRGNQGLIDALTEATESGVIGSTSTVLLQLGQNQAFTGQDARAVLDAVPTTVRHVVVMTVTGPAVWTDAANEVIRTMPSADGYVTLADWAAFVAENKVELCADQMHVTCSPATRTLYAYFVKTAMEAASGSVVTTTTFPGSGATQTIRLQSDTPVIQAPVVVTLDGGTTSGWTAAVTPSGRLFVAQYSLDQPQPVREVVDGGLAPTGIDITGALRSGPDERLYVIDQKDSRLVAYRDDARDGWAEDASTAFVGECPFRIGPTKVSCGSGGLPVAAQPLASTSISGDLLVTVDSGQGGTARSSQWTMRLELPDGVSLGDCTDDACLINRPYGPDGVLWAPYLAGLPANRQVLVVMRPDAEPIVTWADVNGQPAGVIGVVGDDVYLLSITDGGAGATVSKVPMSAATDPALPDGPARPVKEYAAALASGDWMAAAKLLGEGGDEWSTRADLRPLYRPEFGLRPQDGTTDALAAALEKWCARGTCDGGIESINDLPGDGSWFSVAMTDQGNFSLYRVITFEGQAGIRGLPQAGQGGGGPDYTGSGTLCPTDLPIERTAWADLDGDGWLELIVVQVVNGPTDESGTADYRVGMCGSLLTSPSFDWSADGLSVNVVPAFGSTPETLLVGSPEGYLSGFVYQAVNGIWVQRKSTDGVPAAFAVHPPIQGQPGESVGCETVDGVEHLVRYDYTIDGDTLRYHYVPLVGPPTFDVDDTAPIESEEAVRVQTGVCGGLPVISN